MLLLSYNSSGGKTYWRNGVRFALILVRPVNDRKTWIMKKIQVFDPPMCCSTGICGPQVDPVLPRFAADLNALKLAGHSVQRFNLSQNPQEFIQNKSVHELLSTQGTDCLPVIIVDGEVVSQGTYPTAETLQQWAGAEIHLPPVLPVMNDGGGACSGPDCC